MIIKYNEIVKPGLTFTTPAGKTGRVIGVEKDLTVAPVWRNRVEHFGWIVTARIDGELVNLKFNQQDSLVGVKYNHEPLTKWRGKL